MTVPDEEVFWMTRCERCGQLTQEKDLVVLAGTEDDDMETEVCGWCAADLEKVAQRMIHYQDRKEKGLFDA